MAAVSIPTVNHSRVSKTGLVALCNSHWSEKTKTPRGNNLNNIIKSDLQRLCRWRAGPGIGGAVPVLLVLAGCGQIETLNQPSQVRVGQVIEVPIGRITTAADYTGTATPYAGIHLPVGWSVE